MSSYLYRFFDKENRLLYVGISYRLEERFHKHRFEKPWDLIKHISVEDYPSRQEALAAELQAIRTEHPAWNIVGRLKAGNRSPVRTRRGYREQSRIWWPDAEWIAGTGRWATLAHCRVLTVELHQTEEAALAAKRSIDRTGCGGFCVDDHTIIDIEAGYKGDGPDLSLLPICEGCQRRLSEWFRWGEAHYCTKCWNRLDMPPTRTIFTPVNLDALMRSRDLEALPDPW